MDECEFGPLRCACTYFSTILMTDNDEPNVWHANKPKIGKQRDQLYICICTNSFRKVFSSIRVLNILV